MAEIIRQSAALQQYIDSNNITKKDILESSRENPQILSAEYANGILTIITTIDAAPIIIEVALKD